MVTNCTPPCCRANYVRYVKQNRRFNYSNEQAYQQRYRFVLLGRVALVKLSRARSVGLSVHTYVRTCVGRLIDLSSALWQNVGSDPDAVWHHRSDGSRDEVGLGIGLRKGVLLGPNLGRAIITNEDFTAYVCDSAATRPFFEITLGKLNSGQATNTTTSKSYANIAYDLLPYNMASATPTT